MQPIIMKTQQQKIIEALDSCGCEKGETYVFTKEDIKTMDKRYQVLDKFLKVKRKHEKQSLKNKTEFKSLGEYQYVW